MTRQIRQIPGCIYLLHFDAPLHHASHYMGSTDDLPRRMDDHANGFGARLTEVLKEIGQHWQLAAVFVPTLHASMTLRELERRAKNHKKARDFCPICCHGDHAAPPFTVEYPTPQNYLSQILRRNEA